MALHPITQKIKAALVDMPDMWVRGWRDGTVWVGSHDPGEAADKASTDTVITTLTAAGFKCKSVSVPGTSFKTCIEVSL